MSDSSERKEIDLPAGRIRYREAGTGKPIVFVHGYLVDGRLWAGVVDRLGRELSLRRDERHRGRHDIAGRRVEHDARFGTMRHSSGLAGRHEDGHEDVGQIEDGDDAPSRRQHF